MLIGRNKEQQELQRAYNRRSGICHCVRQAKGRKNLYDECERGAQIGMLIDRADNLVNLCEMKFSSDEYVVTEADLRSIRHKAARFSQDKRGRRKSICITMIAACGLSHSAGYWASIPFAISGDDLFNS